MSQLIQCPIWRRLLGHLEINIVSVLDDAACVAYPTYKVDQGYETLAVGAHLCVRPINIIKVTGL